MRALTRKTPDPEICSWQYGAAGERCVSSLSSVPINRRDQVHRSSGWVLPDGASRREKLDQRLLVPDSPAFQENNQAQATAEDVGMPTPLPIKPRVLHCRRATCLVHSFLYLSLFDRNPIIRETWQGWLQITPPGGLHPMTLFLNQQLRRKC